MPNLTLNSTSDYVRQYSHYQQLIESQHHPNARNERE